MSEPLEFFIDPMRCIGCQACVSACRECGTHRGTSVIHLEVIDRMRTIQTTPMVCMHCVDPTCAEVCPADAIKQTPEGVVLSSLKPRCIGCENCVIACPFGVPKYDALPDQMMKCDQCYDRTSIGLRPWCATVCPSRALYFGPRSQVEAQRRGKPLNRFRFGNEVVETKVNIIVPEGVDEFVFDVAAHISEGMPHSVADLALAASAEDH
ncbi:MAG: 4Fe-4S binding protein [Armatimonadetes bacterium]|nr:4Fe-4S binding protein [Armatimonadota bacterium]